jgi:hypothetical protein
MRAVVTRIQVCAVPFSDPHEDRPWDLFSGPDLCCEVYGPDGARLYRSGTACDVRPSDLPVTLDADVRLAAAGPHILRLLDADLTDDEVVARFPLVPARLLEAGGGSTPPVCVELSAQETTLQVYLSWASGE